MLAQATSALQSAVALSTNSAFCWSIQIKFRYQNQQQQLAKITAIATKTHTLQDILSWHTATSQPRKAFPWIIRDHVIRTNYNQQFLYTRVCDTRTWQFPASAKHSVIAGTHASVVLEHSSPGMLQKVFWSSFECTRHRLKSRIVMSAHQSPTQHARSSKNSGLSTKSQPPFEQTTTASKAKFVAYVCVLKMPTSKLIR